MIHDCSRAWGITIWYKTESFNENKEKNWYICSHEPSWFRPIPGPPWYLINDGDEININKDCRMDIGGRVFIKGNEYILWKYGGDIKIKINIVPYPQPKDEMEKQLWKEFDRIRKKEKK